MVLQASSSNHHESFSFDSTLVRWERKNLRKARLNKMIKEKCFLQFPTIPFIPQLPYDVIATDYDNCALVSGAKDKDFVQVYSRTPNRGLEFIAKYKNYLAQLEYDPEKIKNTPHDCEVMYDGQLAAMMSIPANAN